MNIWYNDFYSKNITNTGEYDIDGREIISGILAEWLMDPNNSTWEAAKDILRVIKDCNNERELKIAEDMFIALTGWSFETLKTRCEIEIKKELEEN